jgi:hypothetical protein
MPKQCYFGFSGSSSTENSTEENAFLFGATFDKVRSHQGLHWNKARSG